VRKIIQVRRKDNGRRLDCGLIAASEVSEEMAAIADLGDVV